jgi:hypothetical protein
MQATPSGFGEAGIGAKAEFRLVWMIFCDKILIAAVEQASDLCAQQRLICFSARQKYRHHDHPRPLTRPNRQATAKYCVNFYFSRKAYQRSSPQPLKNIIPPADS